MLCVYKVSFEKSSFDLIDDYDKLSEIDKERISDLDAIAFFDFDIEERYTFFMLVDNIEFKCYSKILVDNLIKHKIEDISNDVLTGKFDMEGFTKNLVSPMNNIKFTFFLDDLNEWIYDNLEIDMVLDRISQVGINQLRKIEKEFLANYSQNK